MSAKAKLAAKITTRIAKALKLNNAQSVTVYEIILEMLQKGL